MPTFTVPGKLTAGLCALSLTLAGCAQRSGDSVAASKEGCRNDSLTVTQASTGLQFLPSYVAQHAGYYKEEGLNIKTTVLNGGTESIAAVVSDSADVALSAYGSVIKAVDKNAPVIAFATVVDGVAANLIAQESVAAKAGLKDSSTPEQKIRALKGATIGISSPGSGDDQLVRYLFKKTGMDPDKDAKIVTVGVGPSMLAAFEQRRIDAFAPTSPIANIAVDKGGRLLLNLAKGDYKPLDNFLYGVAIANSRTLQSKSRVLTCFTKAIGRALRLIDEDPARAVEVARPAFSQIDPKLYQAGFEWTSRAYAASTVIDRGATDKVFAFTETLLGRPKRATAENTTNTKIAEGASSSRS